MYKIDEIYRDVLHKLNRAHGEILEKVFEKDQKIEKKKLETIL